MGSCARNRKRLSAYIDSQLPERVRRSVERHLGECPSCRFVYDELRELSSVLGAYDAPPVPNGLSSRILAEAASRQRGRSYEKFPNFGWREFLLQPWLVRGVTTAALFVGLAMGGWMGWMSYRSPDSKYLLATIDDGAEGTLYAFDILIAEPQGSIAAATLALLGDKK